MTTQNMPASIGLDYYSNEYRPSPEVESTLVIVTTHGIVIGGYDYVQNSFFADGGLILSDNQVIWWAVLVTPRSEGAMTEEDVEEAFFTDDGEDEGDNEYGI